MKFKYSLRCRWQMFKGKMSVDEANKIIEKHFQENNVPEDEEFVFNIYLKNDMRLGLIRRNGNWLVAGYRPQIKVMFIKSESRGDIKIEKDEDKTTITYDSGYQKIIKKEE